MVTDSQPKGTKKPETPVEDERGGLRLPGIEAMNVLVTKLTHLRATYLEELKEARDKVKKNFLK